MRSISQSSRFLLRSCALRSRTGRGRGRPGSRPVSRHSFSPSFSAMCSVFYPTHNQSPVDPHDEIKPRLQRELRVFIAENLEPKGTVVGGLRVLDGLRVQPADKAVQGSKHTGSILFYSVLENRLWTVLRPGDLMEAQVGLGGPLDRRVQTGQTRYRPRYRDRSDFLRRSSALLLRGVEEKASSENTRREYYERWAILMERHPPRSTITTISVKSPGTFKSAIPVPSSLRHRPS